MLLARRLPTSFLKCVCILHNLHFLGRKKLYSSFSVQYVSCQHFVPSIVWQSIPSCQWACTLSLFSKLLIPFFFLQKQSMLCGSFPTILKIFHGALGCFQGIVFGTSWSQLQTPTFRCNELSQRNIIFCGTLTALGTNNPLFHFFMRHTLSLLFFFWHFRFLFWFPPRAFFPYFSPLPQSGQSDSFLGVAQAISSSVSISWRFAILFLLVSHFGTSTSHSPLFIKFKASSVFKNSFLQ